MTGGWIGVDLDGTLAYYESWDEGRIGKPIPRMVQRVKEWLQNGVEVRIVTARVSGGSARADEAAKARAQIRDWCREHIGQPLEVTCCKDYAMIQLWDDRCVQVIPNTGERADYADLPMETEASG